MPKFQREFDELFSKISKITLIFKVSATTANGKAFILNGLVKKDGRTYAFDVDTNGWGCNLATNVSKNIFKNNH